MNYPRFKKEKFDQNKDFSMFLREESTRWLCNIDDDLCLINANIELITYISNSSNNYQ